MADMPPREDVERAMRENKDYARHFGDKGALARSSGKGLLILTCMDGRIDPLGLTGLDLGDAIVLRNAGGRVTDDVMRSLAAAIGVLGVREVWVIHHTGCGMQGKTNDALRSAVNKTLGSVAAAHIDFLPFEDLEGSIIEDVRRINDHALVPSNIAVYGFAYDLKTGRLREVEAASDAGRAIARVRKVGERFGERLG